MISVAGAFGLALLVALATWPPGARIELFEYGHWLGPASDMLHGKVPYRDTFPVHGFLSDGGLDALLFQLTGASFSRSVWLHQALGVLFQPAIFLVAAAATRKPLPCLALIPLALAVAPGLVFDRAVLPLLGLAAFLWAIDERRRRLPAAIAGALAVAGVLYALDFGSFVAAAEAVGVAAAAVIGRSRAPILRIREFLVGAAVVALPVAAALRIEGALEPFLRTSFRDLPATVLSAWGLPFPRPLAVAESWRHGRDFVPATLEPAGPMLAARLYLIPLCVLICGVLLLAAMRRGGRPAAVLRGAATLLTCALCFRYVFGRSHHEAGNALVAPALLAAWFAILSGKPVARRYRIAAAIAVVVIAALFGGLPKTRALVSQAMRFRSRISDCGDCVRLTDLRGGGIRVPRAEADQLHRLASLVTHYAPAGPILDLSNRPGLYFFLDRVNPTRFYQVPLMAPFEREVIHDLEGRPPTAILLSSGTELDAFDGRSNAARIPAVWRWVEDHYLRHIQSGRDVLALPGSGPIAAE